MTNEEKLRFTLIDGLKYGMKVTAETYSTKTVNAFLSKDEPTGEFITRRVVGFCLETNEICIETDGSLTSTWDNAKYWKPNLRPMSDLVKPITVTGYNDGKPFVPIKQLLKEQEFAWFKDALPRYEKITYGFDGRRVRAFVHLHATKSIDLHIDFIHNWPQWIIEFLDMWHFNRRDLPEDMYIKIQE